MAQLDSKNQPSREPSHPLAGRRIVVTRARSQASSLARRLKELGGEVIEFPTIEIQPPESYAALDEAIREIHAYDWLIFTSVNGVEQFFNRSKLLDKSPTRLEGIEIAAIGPETASAVEAAGLRCRLVPKQYQAEGLLELLTPEQVHGKRVLLPRAAQAREILPETLREWGAQVDVIEAYRTVIPASDVSGLMYSIQKREIDMVTFTSSSTVTNFVRLLEGQRLADSLRSTAIACIGPITQKTVEELGGHADVVAEEFTILGLVQAIVKYFALKANANRHAVTKDATA
jgi:uroporphyrinogen III methyltransferase / synthase